jgi:hypothetical protein
VPGKISRLGTNYYHAKNYLPPLRIYHPFFIYTDAFATQSKKHAYCTYAFRFCWFEVSRHRRKNAAFPQKVSKDDLPVPAVVLDNQVVK